MGANQANQESQARLNWQRYEYGRMRGHQSYCRKAREAENFYLGGGRQWDPEDRQRLEEEGRPALEFNQIKHKINTAIGYQIQNRMDINYQPRGQGADEDVARVLTKVAKQVADNTSLHWLETQVFGDGLIQQRGYFDIRISYRDSILGEITITDLDPLDVIPDPDAKSYDPDKWQDVIITRWLTYDEIEEEYGKAAREKCEAESQEDQDFGDDESDEERNKFGNEDTGNTGYMGSATLSDGSKRVRVIERQFWRTEKARVVITLTGDIRSVEGRSDEEVSAMPGVVPAERRIRRVRWVISTYNDVLHDDWSPFNHFTVVPFFPFFRRGKTAGLVDDAIGPQQLLNKTMSQFLHTVNSTANSGWMWWADTIANMSDDEMANRGAEPGLAIVLKSGTGNDKVPKKIQPNQIPTGIDRIVERAGLMIDETTGINDAMTGNIGREVSGVAIQSRQFAAQQGLAVPLDNLARTRNMVANRILELVQDFYDEPRILRITEQDSRGRDVTEELLLNYPQEGGGVLNDLTIGEYDVVVTEQPMQVTFENGQFTQIMEMREKGIRIPDAFVVSHSNVTDKQEIIEAMEQQAQQPPDPLNEARAELAMAQAEKVKQEAVNRAVEAQYSAVQTAATIATNPLTAGLADKLLRSAGQIDRDEAPIVPSPEHESAASIPTNTNPLTPASPGVGLMSGIETKRIEGAPA
ncbi:portal protein [Aquipseudomonas campi]